MKSICTLFPCVMMFLVQSLQAAITNEHISLSGTNSFSSTLENNTAFFWHPNKKAFRAGQVPSGSNHFKDAGIGYMSFSFGYNPKASGSYATAIGYFAFASGSSALSIGNSTIASGGGSIALGTMDWDYYYYETQATAEGAIAIGTGARATASHAVSIGQLNLASASSAVSLGSFNDSTGYASFTAGMYNDAEYAYSAGMGYGSKARAGTSTVVGSYLISNSRDSFVVGRYNDPVKTSVDNSDPDRPVFIVGVGTGVAGNRENALTVLADGTILIKPQGDIGMGMFGTGN